MEISVIIPVYNAEKTLQRTLDALRVQDFFSFEVILVDNGSTDKSSSICKENCQKDSRFRYRYTEKKGVSNARNIGVSESRAKYLCFCDADDIPEVNMLSALHNKISKSNYGMAMCNYYSERDNRNSEFPFQWGDVLDDESIRTKLIPAMFFSETGGDVIWGTVWRAIFRRNIIVEHKLKFDEKLTFAEDLCFFLEYLNCISSLILESKVLYKYSMVEGSAMLSYNRYKEHIFEERMYLISKIDITMKNIFGFNVPKSLQNKLNTIYQEYILECIGNACILEEKNMRRRAFERVERIVNSSMVREIFCEIDVENLRKKLMFELIKHRCRRMITLYYLLRKKLI